MPFVRFWEKPAIISACSVSLMVFVLESLVRTKFSKRVARNFRFNGPDYYRRFCLKGPNNREIRQSGLSAFGHGFEDENSRIRSRVYAVFWYRFLYKILDFKQ